MKCFNCGKILYNITVPCPNCGYFFTADDDRYCPNSNFGKCNLTGKLCNKGINYATCEIKNDAEQESDF